MLTTLSIAAILTACAWTDPGRDPYRGSVEQALQRYSMPASTRAELAALISAGQPTDVATITRDSMTGQRGEYVLTEMHFGAGRVCGTMDRSAWHQDRQERAPVYCAGSTCVAVPDVCNNVSRVALLPPATIRTMPPASGATLDEIPGGTGLAEQTLPEVVPVVYSVPGIIAQPDPQPRTFARSLDAPAGSDFVAVSALPFAGPPLVAVAPAHVVPSGFVPIAPIPEPATLALIALGLVMLTRRINRR